MSLLRDNSRIEQRTGTAILPVLAVVLMISAYPIIRYGGLWNIGNDTAVFTSVINIVHETGKLIPTGQQLYPSGFGFQAVSVFLMEAGGISLPGWQFYGAILLIVWVVFPAWLLYREWVGSGVGATLAALILFAQPDFLFGIMRGTHEKFSRGLILLCLLLLTYSLSSRRHPSRAAASMFAFYLTCYALITLNAFFASSFIAAVLLALGMVWVLAWRARSVRSLAPTMQRMACIVLVSMVLVFLHLFYLYPPAQDNLKTLGSITNQTAVLFLEVEQADSFNPYATPVLRAWISPYVFLLLNLFNWVLLIGSVTIWASMTVRWLIGRQRPSSHVELLQWAFYAAFMVQGALAVLADFSGALTGNLQHRMFPTIGMVGAPIVARGLLHVLRTARKPVAQLAHAGVWAGIGLFSFLALVKATNEPVLSNEWQTYLPAEVRALEWAENTLADRSVWTGFDRRLVEVRDVQTGSAPRRVIYDRFEVDDQTDNFLVSELTRLQVARLGGELPMEFDDFVTFDNGEAQIYHRRPRTLYQR